MEEKLPGIKHIIAVASGKGGVGKSTISVNLALALRQLGARVGVVDADILGPSIPAMLGISEGDQPETLEGQLLPVERFGIKSISMGMLTSHDAPAILRGPMITKYMRLFVQGTVWGELDYLILDLPPGTGDIQLTLAQSIPLSGAIIVTTPQQVSLNIARRGVRMFEKVNVPLLGIIENMSGFVCPKCQTNTPIFHQHGGKALSDLLHLPLLGSIPIDPSIVQSGDHGKPFMAEHNASIAGQAYKQLAETLVQTLAHANAQILPPFKWLWESNEGQPPSKNELIDPKTPHPKTPVALEKRDARTLSIVWQDGRKDDFDGRDLRLVCPCAMCVDEMSGKRTLDPNKVPLTVTPKMISNVGRYALAITFTDGHNTGIFSFERLRQLGETKQKSQTFEV